MPVPSTFAARYPVGILLEGGCRIVATPEARRRLLALAVAALAPAVIPADAGAQNTASGTVRLVVREIARPVVPTGDTRLISWMADESLEETERVAALWASGDESRALAAWRRVVEVEFGSFRMQSEEQVEAAADWIALRTGKLRAVAEGNESATTSADRIRDIRMTARAAALARLRNAERSPVE